MKLMSLLQRRDAQFIIHFRRQIDNDQAVDTGFQCVVEETIDAMDVDRIVVTHQNNRCVLIIGTKTAGDFQRLDQCLTTFQGALTGQLDRRAIGHRIGKRHAEFDNVGTGRRQSLHDRQRRLEIRIACHEIGDQRWAAFGCQIGKSFVHACGHAVTAPFQAVCRR